MNRERTILLWLRIARVYGRLSKAARHHIQQHGLTPAQFDVIAQAGATPGLTQEQLAQRLFVTQGNITQLLGRMENADLVRRERDARCNRVRLTPAGQELYKTVVPHHEAYMAERFDVLMKDEQAQLVTLLRKLDQGLRLNDKDIRT